jgi:hypothetical protein
MQTEQIEKQNWMSLSGRILEGGFELKDLIEADDTRALFRVRVLGDRELVATASFRRLDPADANRQAELWQSVRDLRDQHLNFPLGCGTTELNGSRTAYVVFRQPDESLAGVLKERPLTAAEMKEALLNIAKGLENLHLNGLVHGNISPGQILAIGDSIRLSCEGVRTAGVAPPFEPRPASYLAPESKGTNLTPESDMWCLGATIFETLSQKAWAESDRERADALPEPFATVALRCLVVEPSERCRLPEAVALVRGEIKPSPRPKPVPPAPAPALPTVVAINEKEIHAAANGKPPVTPISEPPAESAKPQAEEAKSQSQAASAGSTVAPAAFPANGVPPVKSGPENRVESRPADRKPTAVPTPVPSAPITAKVKPITEGPAPTPLAQRPLRQEARFQRDEGATGDRSSKIWIWAGLAILAVLLLVWALRPKHSVTVASGPAAPATGAKSPVQTRAGGNAWETKTIQPDGTASNATAPNEARTPSAPVAPAAAAPKTSSKSHAQTPATTPVKEAVKKPENGPANGNVWRTVLYTYNRQALADEKAKALNAQHANLHAEVFSPSGNGGPYLVCAGGRMSREDANQMRKRAVGLGMPRDSYIQNFKH